MNLRPDQHRRSQKMKCSSSMTPAEGSEASRPESLTIISVSSTRRNARSSSTALFRKGTVTRDMGRCASSLCVLVILWSSLSLMVSALEDLGDEVDMSEDWLAPMNESGWQEWAEPDFFSDEQSLMHRLVGNYENSVRPVFNASDPVDVRLGLTLTQILDLDEKNQVLTTNVWLEAEWYDERLRWNSSEFGGISSIRIPCERIWLPDIVLYNSVDDYTSGYMPSLAMVYNDSRVFWGPVIRFRSSCKIDITFFPFDDQVCRLKLGSWAYNGFQVNVWNRSDTMDLSNFVDNGEWELIGVKVRRNVVTYNCCDEPFPDVTFYVHLRRRIKYYFMNIIIPCIILSFLCLAGFLLPPESGEKITLGLSVLLTITVFMLMVADKMPQTSESISVISIYLMVVLATSCLSVLSSVLVLSIHHQRGKPRRVPAWLRLVVFGVVAKVVCVKTYTQHHKKPKHRKKSGHEVSARHKERKITRSPRRGRVATEETEYLKMELTSKAEPATYPNNPSTQPLLPHSVHPVPYFTPGGRERGWSGQDPRDGALGRWRDDSAESPIQSLRKTQQKMRDDADREKELLRENQSGDRGSHNTNLQYQDAYGDDRDTPRTAESTFQGDEQSGSRVDMRENTAALTQASTRLRRNTSPCISPAENQTTPKRRNYRNMSEATYRSGEESSFCVRRGQASDSDRGRNDPDTSCRHADSTFIETENTPSSKYLNASASEFKDSERKKAENGQTIMEKECSESAADEDENTSENDKFSEDSRISDHPDKTMCISEDLSMNDVHTNHDNRRSSTSKDTHTCTDSNTPNTRTDHESRSHETPVDANQYLNHTHNSSHSHTHTHMTRTDYESRSHETPADVNQYLKYTHNTNHAQPLDDSQHRARRTDHESRGHETPPTDVNQFINHVCNTLGSAHNTNHAQPPDDSQHRARRRSVNSEDRAVIQRLINVIQTKHVEEVKEDEVYREWHDVACVLDRLLFYVFLVITLVSSVAILEMRPTNVDF